MPVIRTHVTFLYGMKVGETLRQAGVGDRAPSAM